jgi:hypothetical protein
MCVIPHQIPLFLFVYAEYIGDKPTGIYIIPVEPGEFKVPVGDLENMKFDIVYILKNEISVLHLHHKQGGHIRPVFFLEIKIEIFRIPEGFVKVHEVEFMAHRMDEVFQVGRIIEMGKP